MNIAETIPQLGLAAHLNLCSYYAKPVDLGLILAQD